MKFVYLFGEGDATMRNLLGGKGANLCEMTKLKLPVPQGFILTTEACTDFHKNGELSVGIEKQIFKALKKIEKINGKKFGSEINPLILSVRSGARVSMPGMMDSVLNLGLNDNIVKGFAKITGNAKFAYDCYRRFIQMYGNVVKKINDSLFEKEIEKLKKANKIKLDQEFTETNLKELIKSFKVIYKNAVGETFPQDVHKQLLDCVAGVFQSWNNERAKVYRKLNNISDDWGTAVNIQTMVFGNMHEKSGTGVCFSRNPSTGENAFYGEYLMNAQGEDIVAGIRTPHAISELKTENEKIYNELHNYALVLENFYKDMQDMEFTIENGKLYVLQTRNGKRTTLAGLKIAVDLVEEKQITKETALSRIEPEKLGELLHSSLIVPENLKPIATGIPASPGGAVGKIALTAKKAIELSKRGEKTILVRLETSAEDIEGMSVAQGALTARGGMTSHAAVVARGMGTVCVSGCGDLEFSKNSVSISGKVFKEGDIISLDGTTGKVYKGELQQSNQIDNEDFNKFIAWAKEFGEIDVFVNADTPEDAKLAMSFGASGIGLCRTEHMFFGHDRIKEMRKMILAENVKDRNVALKNLLPFQKSDFEKIFTAINGKSAIIRLLDPPLHEFLPKNDKEINEIAKELGKEPADIKTTIDNLKEVNPMMGHRGLRLSVTFPEIYEMQTRAIIESALSVQKKLKIRIEPEIMIPLASDVAEFLFVKNIVKNTAEKYNKNGELTYKIGAMIETPRACMLAGELAGVCDFFSFGTNDLSQFTFAFSRDDAGNFLKDYYKKQIFKNDVFAHIDTEGVGKLMEIAITSARKANPKIKIGVCGEHGGDPLSIEFFKKIKLDYVSCSVFRVPVAILASL